ncbi:MAG TPA: hypothetical protein ENO22_07415 [candidate division Zixibacteria bacterium]|nr:hypothetical protein [candidate division Zixibacteria bacterium]
MDKQKTAQFDVYMARLKQAKECAPRNRTSEQKQLLQSTQSAPSYNALFGKSSKNNNGKSE